MGIIAVFVPMADRRSLRCRGKIGFVEWKKVHPFRGSIDGKQYIFDAPDGNVDRLDGSLSAGTCHITRKTARPGWSFQRLVL